jgi:ribose transport system permease protein
MTIYSESKDVRRKAYIGAKIEKLVPPVILIIFVLAFFVLNAGSPNLLSSIKLVLNGAIPYVVAGLGTLFVTALGGTDITQGALVSFEFAVMVVVGNAFGGAAGIIAGLICGIASGFSLGIINTKCKVPSFMVSLGLLVFFRALGTMVGGTAYITVPDFLKTFGRFSLAVPIVIVFYGIMHYLFHSTPYGNYVRAIGENENAVKFSGVDTDLVKITAFILSGFMTAVAGILSLGTQATLLPATTGLGFEMSILIAMFIGGTPVRGGHGCRMYMVIIGAFTVAIMENILGSRLLMETYYVQLIKGLLLIGLLFLASALKRRAGGSTAEAN